MEPERTSQHKSFVVKAVNGDRDTTASDACVSCVVDLYAHLSPQSLDTLVSLVRALRVSADAWMDQDGRPLVSSNTASVLIVTPDNVERCARRVTQQVQSRGRLRLTATGHWAGMISLFYETIDPDRCSSGCVAPGRHMDAGAKDR
nr:Isocitrate dehydrogenase [Pandoravirus massiliensis]